MVSNYLRFRFFLFALDSQTCIQTPIIDCFSGFHFRSCQVIKPRAWCLHQDVTMPNPRRMRLPDADAEASAEQAILEKLEEACNDWCFFRWQLSLFVKPGATDRRNGKNLSILPWILVLVEWHNHIYIYITYHLVIPSRSELHSPKMHYVIFLEFTFWTLPMLEHVETLVHHAADSEPLKSSWGVTCASHKGRILWILRWGWMTVRWWFHMISSLCVLLKHSWVKSNFQRLHLTNLALGCSYWLDRKCRHRWTLRSRASKRNCRSLDFPSWPVQCWKGECGCSSNSSSVYPIVMFQMM